MNKVLLRAFELMQQNRLPEAQTIVKKLIKTEPKNETAWFLLAQIEQVHGRWSESISNYLKAQSLNPANLTMTEYLATARMQSNQGRMMVAAIDDYAAVLAKTDGAPGAVAIATNLQTLALRNDEPEKLLAAVGSYYDQYILPDSERMRMAAGLCIASFITGDFERANGYAREVIMLKHFAFDAQDQPLPGDYPFYYIYMQFLADLMEFRRTHPALYEGETSKKIHTIGESHCLTPTHTIVAGQRVRAHLMMGIKCYYFTVEKGESVRYRLESIIRSIPKDEAIVIMFGEIDCRANDGIMEKMLSDPTYDMKQEVANFVAAYVKFVKIAQLKRAAPTCLYGVPASVPPGDKLVPERWDDFRHLILYFNQCLAQEALKQGLPFIDIYALTAGPDGWAKEGVHIDGVHLMPDLVAGALAAALEKPLAG